MPRPPVQADITTRARVERFVLGELRCLKCNNPRPAATLRDFLLAAPDLSGIDLARDRSADVRDSGA